MAGLSISKVSTWEGVWGCAGSVSSPPRSTHVRRCNILRPIPPPLVVDQTTGDAVRPLCGHHDQRVAGEPLHDSVSSVHRRNHDDSTHVAPELPSATAPDADAVVCG